MAERLYQFKPMLGPAEEWPAGSIEWAERMSNRLQLATQSVTRSTAHSLRDHLKAICTVKPRPWEIWPKGKPFGTPEDYSRKVTGHGWKALIEIVKELTGDRSLESFSAEKLLAENARAQVETKPQGKHHNGSSLSNKDEGVSPGGTRAAYLLRRLARDHPAILSRYEAGTFPSVRAAARAAGIVPDPPAAFEQVLKLLKKHARSFTEDQKRACREELS